MAARTMFPIRLGSALQIRGSRLTTLLVYQYTRFMNSQKTPLRLSKITPRFHGTRIGMSRIHLCKKVNLVKNVTYEVLSRRRRYLTFKRNCIKYAIILRSLAFTGNHLSNAKQWELSVIIVTSLCIAKHS